jgi:hypothetical protein
MRVVLCCRLTMHAKQCSIRRLVVRNERRQPGSRETTVSRRIWAFAHLIYTTAIVFSSLHVRNAMCHRSSVPASVVFVATRRDAHQTGSRTASPPSISSPIDLHSNTAAAAGAFADPLMIVTPPLPHHHHHHHHHHLHSSPWPPPPPS